MNGKELRAKKQPWEDRHEPHSKVRKLNVGSSRHHEENEKASHRLCENIGKTYIQ